jgi:hypothetical protein
MPDFIATAPDGRKFKITAPEGATQAQMQAYAEANLAKLPPLSAPSLPRQTLQPQQPQQQPDGILGSVAKGAGEGFAGMVLGGQQLVGKGLSAVGATGAGGLLQKDAARGLASEAASTAADKKAHPWATEIGELLGGSVGPGGAAAKLVKGARPIAQAALAGGISGALSPVDAAGSYWWEKAKQIGLGTAIGGVLGGLAAKIGSPAVKGVSGDAKKLVDAGVKLTPGQMIGGAAKGIEEKATSAPITGHFISNALHETTKSFNIATINKALAPIGAKLPNNIPAGHDAVAAAGKALGTAYDTILPRMSLKMDKDLANELTQVVTQGRGGILPADKAAQFEAYLRARVLAPFKNYGRLDGDQLKKVEADLSERASRYTRSQDPADRDYADAINAVKTSIRGALTRQNPNYAAELQKVNQGYAMLVRIQNAAQRRVTSGGVFTPGDLLGAIKATDKSVRKSAFARGDALLQDWAEAGQKVIGNRTPDSGTAGRLMAKDLLGVSAGPLSAVPLAAAGLPYTKAGQAAIQRMATAGQAARKPVAKAVAGAGLYLAPGAAQAANGGGSQ